MRLPPAAPKLVWCVYTFSYFFFVKFGTKNYIFLSGLCKVICDLKLHNAHVDCHVLIGPQYDGIGDMILILILLLVYIQSVS